jgi:hypothetical protein
MMPANCLRAASRCARTGLWSSWATQTKKVMSLTVDNQRLRKHAEKLENLLLDHDIEW